jgi:hypothetical protein
MGNNRLVSSCGVNRKHTFGARAAEYSRYDLSLLGANEANAERAWLPRARQRISVCLFSGRRLSPRPSSSPSLLIAQLLQRCFL